MKDAPIRPRAVQYWQVLKTLGPGWALRRSQLALLTKLGVIEQRTPIGSWSDIRPAEFLKPDVPANPMEFYGWRRDHPSIFLFEEAPGSNLLNSFGTESINGADAIAHGEFPSFGYTTRFGYPPHWHRNASGGLPAPEGHWSNIDEFAFGDIKVCWELSRFSWAYVLARAYARTGDCSYAEIFWELLESWMQQNQPNSGVNWKCGQEASFRTMAICFASQVFRRSPASTPDRIARLILLIEVLGRRIDAYIEYARSQKNNHGISEGAGLWTIGLLFPELQKSDRWRTRGKRVIEAEARRQMYEDGSYVQHSTNYHRVMLQDLAWSLRLGEANGDRLAPDIYERFAKAVRFLHSLADPESGSAPNCGANDGALILPLSDSDFSDMRPVLQSCYYIVEKRRLYGRGPWDEEMIWMNGADAQLAAEPPPSSVAMEPISAEIGGYYTIRATDSWAMMRAARYKDRPSHADQLHFDLWWHGENVLCDSGTYSYNAAIPFDHAFAETRFHNTVTLDSTDQMTRTSRFLWTDWAQARVIRSFASFPEIDVLQGEHDGYRRQGVLHRRAVIQPLVGAWIVIDDLTGEGVHTARIHWLTPEMPAEFDSAGILRVATKSGSMRVAQISTQPSTFDLVRAGERIAGDSSDSIDLARGWLSLNYGRLGPALSFETSCHSKLPIRFVTVVLLGTADEIHVSPACTVISIGQTQIQLSAVGRSPVNARFA